MAATRQEIAAAIRQGITEKKLKQIYSPDSESISLIKSLGFKIIAFENVGMGKMEPCEPTAYNHPEFISIDYEEKIVSLHFL